MARYITGAIFLLYAAVSTAQTVLPADTGVGPPKKSSAAASRPVASSALATSSAPAAVKLPESETKKSIAQDLGPATTAVGKAETTTSADDKPVDTFARVVAIVGAMLAAAGLGLGILNTVLANRKVKRDRLLSIDDDFWFRKIITPTTIEPMLKVFVDLLQEMPVKSSTAEIKLSYSLKVTREFQKLYASVQSLALFSETLPEEVSQKLRACEDTLTEYCMQISNETAAEAGNGEDSPPSVSALSIEASQSAAWKQLNDVVKVIRDHQLAHGNARNA